MQQSHFQQMWHCGIDVHVTTRKFWLPLFCIWTSYLSQLFGCNAEILLCSDVLHAVKKLCKPKSIFKQTHVNFFLLQKCDIISQLHHSYAKGPFCVTRLIYTNVDTDRKFSIYFLQHEYAPINWRDVGKFHPIFTWLMYLPANLSVIPSILLSITIFFT